MSTAALFIGYLFMVIGAITVIVFLVMFIHLLFFAQQKAQSQCPYCHKVWKDNTWFKELWNDKVAWNYHARKYHKAQYLAWRADYKAQGSQFAVAQQRARIKAGIEPALPKGRVTPWWEKDNDTMDE